MADRPILFSGAMVRAILDGRKTQTRRVARMRTVPRADGGTNGVFLNVKGREIASCPLDMPDFYSLGAHCPYGAPGDRLWVRETWAPAFRMTARNDKPSHQGVCTQADRSFHKRREAETLSGPRFNASMIADDTHDSMRWRPSIHMPRWASRLLLDVTAVRVERLQAISHGDAKAEGIEPIYRHGPCAHSVDAVGPFRDLWEEINGKRASWASNPFVWVVSFRRVA